MRQLIYWRIWIFSVRVVHGVTVSTLPVIINVHVQTWKVHERHVNTQIWVHFRIMKSNLIIMTQFHGYQTLGHNLGRRAHYTLYFCDANKVSKIVYCANHRRDLCVTSTRHIRQFGRGVTSATTVQTNGYWTLNIRPNSRTFWRNTSSWSSEGAKTTQQCCVHTYTMVI